MRTADVVSVVLFVILVVLAQAQLLFGRSRNPRVLEQAGIAETEAAVIDYEARRLARDSAPKFDLESAVAFLRLPVWSAGFSSCDSENSEMRCEDIVNAAEVINEWTEMVSKKKTNGRVLVSIDQQDFPDRMSMLYHAVQIALVTGRRVEVSHEKFAPLQLPIAIAQLEEAPEGGTLPNDYRFGCCDISERYPTLIIDDAAWSQSLYIHYVVGPFLRNEFGYHAAYYLGNWLFGSAERPSLCGESVDVVVQGWRLADDDMLRPAGYARVVKRCGVTPTDVLLITNDNTQGMKGLFGNVSYVRNEGAEMVCALNRMIASRRIVQTFGSRLGWWANAMQGSAGSYVNGVDHICGNFTMSQHGSIWHTYCPIEKEGYIHRINTWLYVCGPNAEDARLFLDHLLW